MPMPNILSVTCSSLKMYVLNQENKLDKMYTTFKHFEMR